MLERPPEISQRASPTVPAAVLPEPALRTGVVKTQESKLDGRTKPRVVPIVLTGSAFRHPGHHDCDSQRCPTQVDERPSVCGITDLPTSCGAITRHAQGC